MKCKRIIKVVSALALTVALLVSTGVVSFAAYTTTTTYIDQNTIKVTSTATDLADGEMATYVAYRNNEFNETNAVYIDQATAEDGSVTFTYQADSDDVKAKVLFGGTGSTTAPDVDGLTINVSVNSGEATPVEGLPTVDADYNDEILAREFEVAIPAGEAVTAVAFNGTPVNAWYVKNGAVVVLDVIDEDGTLAITTEAATVSVTLGTVDAGTGKITAFAKAVCADDDDYGIIIAKANADLNAEPVSFENAEDYSTPVKLPAAGKGVQGGFCVEVEDDQLTAGEYVVAAYACEDVTAATSVTVK